MKGYRGYHLRNLLQIFAEKPQMWKKPHQCEHWKSTSIHISISIHTLCLWWHCFRESKVLKRTIQCCVLNGGIFLLSIWLFEYGLLPSINHILRLIFGEESFMRRLIWSWIQPLLSFVFKTIWVLPLFFLSKVINSLWFQVSTIYSL